MASNNSSQSSLKSRFNQSPTLKSAQSILTAGQPPPPPPATVVGTGSGAGAGAQPFDFNDLGTSFFSSSSSSSNSTSTSSSSSLSSTATTITTSSQESSPPLVLSAVVQSEDDQKIVDQLTAEGIISALEEKWARVMGERGKDGMEWLTTEEYWMPSIRESVQRIFAAPTMLPLAGGIDEEEEL